MSRDKFLGTTAIIAVIASVGGGVMAQTVTQGDQPSASSSTEAAQPSMPPELEALNLENIESEIKRGGFREIEGRTSDGSEIEARVDSSGNLIEVEVDDGPMPQSLIEALLPQSIRDNEVIGQFSMIEEIGTRREMLGVKGEDAQGEDLFALFDQDGRLLRFGRDDDKRGGKGMHRDGRHGGPDHGHGDREKHMRQMAKQHADDDRGPRRMPRVEFEPSEVNTQLSDAGYGEFGFLHMKGPRILLDATNPQGEPVILELDPKGEIIRETAR